MPVPDLSTPVVAGALAAFGEGKGSNSATINLDVPLPGAHSMERVVPLELDGGAFAAAASQAGTSLVEQGVVQGDQGRLTGVDAGRLAEFYRRAVPATARPSLRHVAEVGGDVAPLLSARIDGGDLRALAADGVGLLERRALVNEFDDVVIQRRRVDSYLDNLSAKVAALPQVQRMPQLTIPVRGLGNSIQQVTINPVAPPTPTIALLETWELRSYLGDYGLGRTLQTFSLLPGEKTTITVETWRTESATREDATSIFDSSDTAAQTRFTSDVMNSSGAAFQDQGGWSLSVATSASASGSFLGIVSGSASMSAGFAANHQESSQRFSNQVSKSASEHASQVNNSRRQSVDSSSSSSTAAGTATTTVRELSNTNLRRVLNFVFRELNQTYDTYVVLRDIRVAFFNGNPGSADVVPISELRRLIDRHIDPARAEEVARQVLSLCAQRLDAGEDLVTTLEVGTNPDGVKYDWKPAKLKGDGSIDFAGNVLDTDVRWRFRQGALSANPNGPTIEGVIMNRSSVVLRTDNLVVEALLGQADALDPYASALQALDLVDRDAQTDGRVAETRHENDALDLVTAQDDDEMVETWQKLFPQVPQIQVVPVAAVIDDNGDGDRRR
jgi:hypothetical protein